MVSYSAQPRNDGGLLFVYGTLRRGQRNHAVLRDSRFIGCCRTAPMFTLLDFGRFPGVIEPGRTAIVGEVYAVMPGCLAELDALEDCPRRYARRRIRTRYGGAWMYVIRCREQGSVVISGDWLRQLTRR